MLLIISQYWPLSNPCTAAQPPLLQPPQHQHHHLNTSTAYSVFWLFPIFRDYGQSIIRRERQMTFH